MGHLSVFENMIEDKLLNLNTAYIAKVTKYSDGIATVQPLSMRKAYGGSAVKPSLISNIPVIKSARPLEKGDIVLCICCDRDITEARNGNMTTPPIGHHSLSDSVVIGQL